MSMAAPAGRAYFVTGTDTGVGKTVVSCALLRAFAAAGARCLPMKPVAAGADRTPGGLVNEDVVLLAAAANGTAPAEWINPYCFEPPIAPHIAAGLAGVEIDIHRIADACERLRERADVVIVEGAGGFCVPLNDREDMSGLAARLGLPVILVVGLRLGCLNHALLTAAAVQQAGLKLAGWVANELAPDMPFVDHNVDALTARLAAPLLGRLPWRPAPDSRELGALLRVSGL